MKSEYNLFIGIDPGTKTGFAVWEPKSKEFKVIETLTITTAMSRVNVYSHLYPDTNMLVVFEDSRMGRSLFGKIKTDSGRLQGAGSVKRDCAIWEDFLKEQEIPFEKAKPGTFKTKVDKTYFKQLTKFEGITSNHGRDAAMLVFGRK